MGVHLAAEGTVVRRLHAVTKQPTFLGPGLQAAHEVSGTCVWWQLRVHGSTRFGRNKAIVTRLWPTGVCLHSSCGVFPQIQSCQIGLGDVRADWRCSPRRPGGVES